MVGATEVAAVANEDVRCAEILGSLARWADPSNVEGMARYGINPRNTLGVPIPKLRGLAREIGKDHQLALELWESGIHEARILAAFIDVPAQVTGEQMERWVADFDSWDVCDQCCGNLLDKTTMAYSKATEWSNRDEEFVKRAGFVLMTQLAVHDKKARDEKLLQFLPMIRRESTDSRNYVKKAVNWALRQIGKRNRVLNRQAIELARELLETDSRSARWIASDALRELTSEAVQTRLRD